MKKRLLQNQQEYIGQAMRFSTSFLHVTLLTFLSIGAVGCAYIIPVDPNPPRDTEPAATLLPDDGAPLLTAPWETTRDSPFGATAIGLPISRFQ